MKWSAGEMVSEYASIGVRVCGAGRSRMTCGPMPIGRSNRYVVRCSNATLMLMRAFRTSATAVIQPDTAGARAAERRTNTATRFSVAV